MATDLTGAGLWNDSGGKGIHRGLNDFPLIVHLIGSNTHIERSLTTCANLVCGAMRSRLRAFGHGEKYRGFFEGCEVVP